MTFPLQQNNTEPIKIQLNALECFLSLFVSEHSIFPKRSAVLNAIFLTFNIISEFFYLLKFLTSKVINIHEKNGTREKVQIIEKFG